VIGAGAVGLSIARQLAARESTSTILIERHGAIGTETSSRNSEVIHAGIYYGPSSLKTKLCVKGKSLLYSLCASESIPHRNTKKWIIAQDDTQMERLEGLAEHAKGIDVPMRFLGRREIEERGPDVRAEAGVLESESTGIVDSHAFMQFLQGDYEDRGGDVVFNTRVTGIEALDGGEGGYRIHTRSMDLETSGSEEDGQAVIEVETLINAAGLGAIAVNNMLLPPKQHRKPFYAKGTYFSYASGHPKPKTLLYPAPVPGYGGLGTHLTLDMAGRVRFGPDVEWVDDPNDLRPSMSRMNEAVEAIRTYLPGVDKDAIDLDYCGIRPKLSKGSNTWGPGFEDFYIMNEGKRVEEGGKGLKGWINLMGIESPGLTSSLAIAEMAEGMIYGNVGRSADR
jgi:L-2-hydroxyglutarate oxidase LhgO